MLPARATTAQTRSVLVGLGFLFGCEQNFLIFLESMILTHRGTAGRVRKIDTQAADILIFVNSNVYDKQEYE